MGYEVRGTRFGAGPPLPPLTMSGECGAGMGQEVTRGLPQASSGRVPGKIRLLPFNLL